MLQHLSQISKRGFAPSGLSEDRLYHTPPQFPNVLYLYVIIVSHLTTILTHRHSCQWNLKLLLDLAKVI